MSALLAADPAAVRGAAAALDAAADEAARLGRQLDRQRPPCWSSPSHRDYVGQLARLEQRVGRIAHSHDEAAQVLADYARTLDEAQERARWAEQLRDEGSRRSAEWSARQVVGPDPGSGLLGAADRTLADAEALERSAAARAAARLRELAAAAPEQGWTSKVLRPLEDVGMTAVDNVRQAPAGFAALAGSAWSALPWVHGAREQEQGRAALADAAKVWEAWLEAGRDAAHGRPGLAAGALVGGLPRGRSAPAPDASRRKVDGFLSGIAEGRLTVDDLGEAWEQAHAARALQDRILELRKRAMPGVDALLGEDLDLALHERNGSHTIQRHVAASIEMLHARMDVEAKPSRPVTTPRTTFPDLETAERLVRDALLEHADLLREWSVDAGSNKINLPSSALAAPVGTVLRPDRSVTSGTYVNVTLVKDGGGIRILTAYVDETPRLGGRQ